MLVDQRKLDLYADKKFNVLFEGERGVGKTSVIFKTFEKAGLRVKYFSAPTMDPWTDLVGVPSTVTRSDGKEVLRLIQPEDFVDDKYDVIFIDELNRAPKKVMNALMELIQFKTINGRPYNIKMIWAAINPHNEEEEYHVEPLDPAVKDRFQIQIKFPYKVDTDFFKQSFGQVGAIFCQWWNNQPANIQKEISPRRLFDATAFHIDGGDFTDMITSGNTQKLKEDLKSVSQLLVLEKDFKEQNISGSKSILNKNYSVTVSNYLKSNNKIFEFFLPQLNKEWLAKEFSEQEKVFNYMIKLSEANNLNKPIVDEIITDIVSINPGKNNFVKRNIEILGKFLSAENKAIYEAIATKGVNELSSKSAQEATFLGSINDKNLMNKNYNLTGSDLLYYNWSNMKNVSDKAVNLIKKNEIDVDRAILQISERIGAVFALVIAQGNMNSSIQKTLDSITDSKNKSYIWGKPNMDSQFKDLGESIKEVMEKYKGRTPEEIKDEYTLLTASPTRKKQKKL